MAVRPVAGETVSGDLHLIKPFEEGALIAVVDGVGHGDEAMAASKQAIAVLEQHAQESVIALVRRCHEALRQTRGAVLTVASLRTAEHTLTWLGVGNVAGRLLRVDRNASHPCETVLLRCGLVGLQLPALQASVIAVAPGDLLVLATDGVDDRFELAAGTNETTAQIAYRLLDQHFKGTDDGLVLVARYLGGAA